ncbi:hypothetical protein ABT218_21475 [Streptomyces sp. NPDC001455]|uniref:hypothetical protein n=1 Tax=Streptomyces sp. NPDC001455 TaxID=3154518 RepID=UPI0033168EE9
MISSMTVARIYVVYAAVNLVRGDTKASGEPLVCAGVSPPTSVIDASRGRSAARAQAYPSRSRIRRGRRDVDAR